MEFPTISAADNAEIDRVLMEDRHRYWELRELMIRAGYAVAQAAQATYGKIKEEPKVVILAGPGNNGGDGLLTARYLVDQDFAKKIWVVVPRSKFSDPEMMVLSGNRQGKPDFLGKHSEIRVVQALSDWEAEFSESPMDLLIIDAIFGFSFRGWRNTSDDEPYWGWLDWIEAAKKKGATLFVVDIPLGWLPDSEESSPHGLDPEQIDGLISLTAPKKCTSRLAAKTRHWVGGDFLDAGLRKQFGLPDFFAHQRPCQEEPIVELSVYLKLTKSQLSHDN